MLYAEIQDGHQKWQESDFWEKSPVDSAYTLQIKNFVEITLSHTVSKINALLRFTQKIQDGRQKWRESHFCEMSPVDSPYTLCVKNFVEISLSRTFSKISGFAFYAEIQHGHQKWRESDFCEKSPVHSADTLCV